MRKTLTESTILFVSIIKWTVLATIAGLVVGIAVVIFLRLLQWSTGTFQRYDFYYIFLPLTLFLSSLLVRYLAPEAQGHGTEKVIEAIHKRSGKIPLLVVPVKLVATLITLASGGSAGKEGPCAQIGAGLTSFLSTLFRFDSYDRRKMVICGISAGFAAVFGTPIAGSIFGVEVLFIGGMLYDVLLPSFIAGITAFQVSSNLGVTYFYNPLTVVPVFSELFLLKTLLGGVFFGICAMILIESLRRSELFSQRLRLWSPLKAVLGGIILVGGATLFSTRYLGLGIETIEQCLTGIPVEPYAFLVKIFFTSITLSFGGSGGIITPIFFVGSTAGVAFAQLFNLSTTTFAAIGFVSVLAGAANTPIAASIMAVEMFGPAIAPYATLACVVSFLITGHRSVYPSQVLSVSKSPSLTVELGKEVDEIRTTVHLRERGLISRTLHFIKRMETILQSSQQQSSFREDDEQDETKKKI